MFSNASVDRIASWSCSQNEVQIWDLSTGKPGPRIESAVEQSFHRLAVAGRKAIGGLQPNVVGADLERDFRRANYHLLVDFGDLQQLGCSMFGSRVVDGGKTLAIAFTPALKTTRFPRRN